jgi:alanyl-tRNA synthetase
MGKAVGEAAKIADGGGGGKPAMAQAGGKNPAKLGDAIAESFKILENMIQ